MNELTQYVKLTKVKVSCKNCSLAELCLPRGLDRAEVEQLDHIVQRRRLLKRGEHVFRQGDNPACLYAVRTGSLKSYIPTEDGAEQILGFHLPGELLGLDAFETDSHGCAAIALETAGLCTFPLSQLEETCRLCPSLQQQMLKVIAREVAADHKMLLLLGRKTAEQRLATFLLSLSRRFKSRGFSAKEFNLSMPRHDIGKYLGLAVETVSRLLSRFQEEGLLAVRRRHVRIRDINRLHTLANISVA